jgi:transposase
VDAVKLPKDSDALISIPANKVSGESNRTGGISRCGDEMMRMMLYEAAHIMLVRSAKWSWLKAWAMKNARHRGLKKAIVALARRLAVIMHRIWVDGTEFRSTREVAAARERRGIKCDRRKLELHRAVE